MHVSAWDETKAKITAEYINKYATKSVQELVWFGSKENSLEGFIPFGAVEILNLIISGEKVRQPSISFSKLFPKLCELSWTVYDADYTFLECEFPLLERIELKLTSNWKRKKHFFKLLEKNSHIKKFTIDASRGCASEFNLKLLSQLLPQLEYLKIDFASIGNEIVHFENVRSFESSRFYAINKLSFARLESLRTDGYFFSDFGMWKRLAQKHNNSLHTLYVFIREETEYNQLIEVTAMLPNLTKLTVYQYGLNINEYSMIGPIIDSNRNLREIEITASEPPESDLSIPLDRFRNEWNVRCIGEKRLHNVVLERMI